jgi:putative Mg2+ transporter-C (MgtC) family protein
MNTRRECAPLRWSRWGALSLPSSRLTVRGLTLDPTKVASYIVAGIGFLGAGTIFMSRENERIKGLTTAATIWVMAAIGIACGTGLLVEAIVTTALVMIILVVFRVVEQFALQRELSNRQHIEVEVEEVTGQLIASIYETCAVSHVAVEKLHINRTPDGMFIEMLCQADSPPALGKAVGSLHALTGVRSVQARLNSDNRELAAKVNREGKGR